MASNLDDMLLRDLERAGGPDGLPPEHTPGESGWVVDPERAERDRVELRDKRTDLLAIRGLLSPNGGDRVVPFDLGGAVAPAVEWLIDQYTALLPVVEAATAWRHSKAPRALGQEDQLAAAVDAWESRKETTDG